MKKLILSSLILCSFSGLAQFSVSINPDKDNSIYSNNGNSNGVGQLYSGQTCQANMRRALIHFDIAAAVPAGATITAVTLDLNNNNNGSSTSTDNYDLHPLTVDWGEGTSFGTGQGGAAVAPDATWADAMLGTPWTTAGGDFGASVATTPITNSLGTYSWSSAGMVTNVQNWLDVPANNFGWILIGNESGGATCTARRFGSKDVGTAPVLHIDYSCTSAPTASCMPTTVYLDAAGTASITASDIDGGSTSNCGGNVSLSASQTTFNCGDITTEISSLIISGVYDGPLSGGTPKGIELYAVSNIADLSQYGLGSANNGGGTDGEEFTFPAVPVTAGTYIYVSTEATEFTNYFGFAPDYTNGAMLINGDDAVELFKDGAVVDVFGDINTDGTGEPWEYLDSWAYRVTNTGADGTNFTIANWTFAGPNVWDGETTNAGAASPMPIGTFTQVAGIPPIDVTLTVTDDGGNMSSCATTVTVLDTLPPVMACIGSGSFMLDGTGNLTLTVGDIDAGTADNCGIATLSLSQTAFTCTDLGTNIITLYATDVNGNMDSCTASINITDAGGLDVTVDNVVNLLCFGDMNGAINVTTTGGTPPYSFDWDNDGTGDFDDTEDLTGLGAGTYTLNVNDNAGCTTQEIVTVTDPGEILPTFNVTGVSCPDLTDGEIDMTVTGGTAPFTFDWDNDGTGDNDDTEDLTGLDDGNYNITITDANGCQGSSMATVADGVNPDVSVTVMGDVLISNEPNATYQWIECPALTPISGATDSAYTAPANGDYAVIVTSALGCTDTSVCTTVSEVGFDQNDLSLVRIYPNPTNGNFTIQAANATAINYVIYDIYGRVLMSNVLVELETIDLGNVEKGIYFIQLDLNDQRLTKKIILQ